MQSSSYADGFPMRPLEAIEFSYFLSDGEKQEWREWVKSASEDQQKELVDTLHAMWGENQKQVVPQGFNETGPVDNTVSQDLSSTQPLPNYTSTQSSFEDTEPSPALSSNTEEIPYVSEQNLQFATGTSSNTIPLSIPEISKDSPSTDYSGQVVSESKKIDEKTSPVVNKQSDSQNKLKPQSKRSDVADENLMNFGQARYKPNPILDDTTPNPSEFAYSQENRGRSNNPPPTQSQPANQSQRENNQREPVVRENRDTSREKDSRTQTTINPNKDQRENPKNSERSFFNVARVRESATRQALEDIYKQYLESRERSFSSQREYQENHGMFLDKIMQVVINFEQVADYFESMTQKLLEMNDKVVTQARDLRDLKNTSQAKNNDLQDQIDELRRDVDRIFRDTKDLKNDTRRRYEDVSEQMAAFGADAYRQDGILQRLDLVMAKVHKLETANQEPSQSLSIADRLKQRSSMSSGDNQSQLTRSPESSTSNSNRSDRKSTIDLRSVV